MDFNELLNKVIRRTERNVAVAGAMVGSVAAMSKLFPTMEHYSTLKVTFYGGHWLSWDCVASEPLTGPWNDFLKWYHGRPQSASYVVHHREGSNMFRRADLQWYSIQRGERVKKETTE